MTKRLSVSVAAVTAFTMLGGVSFADSTPIGPLPAGPSSTLETQRGQLIAVAWPRRSRGLVWRIARNYDPRVVRQVSEADVDDAVVLVLKATGAGRTSLLFGLTRGETARAFESRRLVVRVRP